MRREYLRSHPSWYGTHRARRDTVFVVTDEDQPGMKGMLIARILLFFRYYDDSLQETIPRALVNWFIPVADGAEGADAVSRLWVVQPERISGQRPVHLEAIARGSHLLLVFGEGFLYYILSLHLNSYYP